MSDTRPWDEKTDPPWRLPDPPAGYSRGVYVGQQPTFDDKGAEIKGKTEQLTWGLYLKADGTPATSPIVVLDRAYHDPDHEAARIALAQEDIKNIAINEAKAQIKAAVEATLGKVAEGASLSDDENRALLLGLAHTAGFVSHDAAVAAVEKATAENKAPSVGLIATVVGAIAAAAVGVTVAVSGGGGSGNDGGPMDAAADMRDK